MPQNPQIAAYVAKQNEYNDAIDASIDGLVGDIKALNDKITELQNTPPVLDPADQALLDDVQAKGAALAAKIKAADDLNPPPTPSV